MTIDGLKDGDKVAIKVTVGRPRGATDWASEPEGTTWVTTRNVASDGHFLNGGNGQRIKDEDIVRPIADKVRELLRDVDTDVDKAEDVYMSASPHSPEEGVAVKWLVDLREYQRRLKQILEGT